MFTVAIVIEKLVLDAAKLMIVLMLC